MGAVAAHLCIWATGLRAVWDALERAIVKNCFSPDCKPFCVKFFFAQNPKSVCHLRPNLVNEAKGYSPRFPGLLNDSLWRKSPISKQMLTPTYYIAAKYKNVATWRIVWNCENSASLCLQRRNRINTIMFFQKAKKYLSEEPPWLWVILFNGTKHLLESRNQSHCPRGQRGHLEMCDSIESLADPEAKSQASSLIHIL